MEKQEVRSLRNEAGMTQEEFAHFLGVTATTVRNWETGRSPVSGLVADGIRTRVKNISSKAAA